jgi:bifunctional DNA-binding transcriptional regulator/antitoxin component of YhaV-PrlF toxin-antitoxin module
VVEVEVELRRKHQMTWPKEVASAMEVGDGDRLVVEYNAETKVATEDVIDYVDAEREGWTAGD